MESQVCPPNKHSKGKQKVIKHHRALGGRQLSSQGEHSGPRPSSALHGLAGRPRAPGAGRAVIGRERRGRDGLGPPLRTYSLVLRVNAALAPSHQRGAALVLYALVNGDGLAAQAADCGPETAPPDAEPCSSRCRAHCCRRHTHRRRHICSADAPPTSDLSTRVRSRASVERRLRLRNVSGT